MLIKIIIQVQGRHSFIEYSGRSPSIHMAGTRHHSYLFRQQKMLPRIMNNGASIILRSLGVLAILAVIASGGSCNKSGGDASPQPLTPDTTTLRYTKSSVSFTGPVSYNYGSTDSALLYTTKEGAASLLSSDYYQGSLSRRGYFIRFKKDAGAAIVLHQPYPLQSSDATFASSGNPTTVYYYPGTGCAITFSALDSRHIAGIVSGLFNQSTGVGGPQTATCTFDFSN